jgi:lipoate-protein ligase A
LLDQFKDCPTNQLPKYAEDSFSIVSEKFKPKFVKTLQSRLSEIEKDTKKKRVEKIIKKLQA